MRQPESRRSMGAHKSRLRRARTEATVGRSTYHPAFMAARLVAASLIVGAPVELPPNDDRHESEYVRTYPRAFREIFRRQAAVLEEAYPSSILGLAADELLAEREQRLQQYRDLADKHGLTLHVDALAQLYNRKHSPADTALRRHWESGLIITKNVIDIGTAAVEQTLLSELYHVDKPVLAGYEPIIAL